MSNSPANTHHSSFAKAKMVSLLVEKKTNKKKTFWSIKLYKSQIFFDIDNFSYLTFHKNSSMLTMLFPILNLVLLKKIHSKKLK